MSNFKFKDSKIKYSSNVESLDSSHTNFIENLNKKKNICNKKIKNIPQLELKLIEHDKNNIHDENYLEDRLQIIEEIEKLKKFEEDLNYDELNYYSKIHPILTNYYELTNYYGSSSTCDNENKKNIQNENKENNENNENNKNNENEENKENINNENTNNENELKKTYINNKLNDENSQENEEERNISKKRFDKLDKINMLCNKKKKRKKKCSVNNVSLSNNIFNYINSDDEKDPEPVVNKSTLYDNYKCIINNESKKINNNICVECKKIKVLHQSKGILVCVGCNEMDKFKPVIDVVDYNESRIKKPKMPYEKESHFSVWMAHFQARETKFVTKEIMDNINLEIKKYNYTEEEKKNISNNHLLKILKKLGYNKHYKNLPYIRTKITGVYPPSFTKDEEELLKKMFKIIEQPFYRNKPKKRKNFLSYSYILYKFCEKLKYDAKKNNNLEKYIRYKKYTKQLILLKTKNLREQDVIWKKICLEINWDYYPSL
jgi:hypothetical protein